MDNKWLVGGEYWYCVLCIRLYDTMREVKASCGILNPTAAISAITCTEFNILLPHPSMTVDHSGISGGNTGSIFKEANFVSLGFGPILQKKRHLASNSGDKNNVYTK